MRLQMTQMSWCTTTCEGNAVESGSYPIQKCICVNAMGFFLGDRPWPAGTGWCCIVVWVVTVLRSWAASCTGTRRTPTRRYRPAAVAPSRAIAAAAATLAAAAATLAATTAATTVAIAATPPPSSPPPSSPPPMMLAPLERSHPKKGGSFTQGTPLVRLCPGTTSAVHFRSALVRYRGAELRQSVRT